MSCLLQRLVTSLFVTLICLTVLSAPATCGTVVDDSIPDPAHRRFIVTQLYRDMRFLMAEPDFYAVVGGLAAAPAAFGPAFRNETPEFTEMWGASPFADNFFESGEVIGDGFFPAVLSLSTWSIGKLTGSDNLRSFGTDILRVQAINGLLTATLKAAVNRSRPDGTDYSYPSGHTSSTFALAAVVHRHYGLKLGLPAFAIAGYTGLSRLQENKHYLSDVIAGAILGSYVGLKLTRKNTPEPVRLSVTPTLGDTKGVAAILSF